jgi:CspA family cold shock protein
MKGKIKTKTDKGYGFIQIEGQDKDLFFHSNDLSEVTFDQLQEGDEVEFNVVEGDKGQRAENVKRV